MKPQNCRPDSGGPGAAATFIPVLWGVLAQRRLLHAWMCFCSDWCPHSWRFHPNEAYYDVFCLRPERVTEILQEILQGWGVCFCSALWKFLFVEILETISNKYVRVLKAKVKSMPLLMRDLEGLTPCREERRGMFALRLLVFQCLISEISATDLLDIHGSSLWPKCPERT